jgi:endonuclease-3 related protein
VIAGAILTQYTAWRNAEQALSRLRARRWLSVRAIGALSEEDLAAAIRSSGAYRQKARKLRAFVGVLESRHGGRLERMAELPTEELRQELLGIWGIGPETADSILLYAFGRPVFVVDAYTRRLLARHGLHPGGDYEEIRAFLEGALPRDVDLYNDFHAQIVWAGQRFCRTLPQCEGCPLRVHLPAGGPIGEPAIRSRGVRGGARSDPRPEAGSADRGGGSRGSAGKGARARRSRRS